MPLTAAVLPTVSAAEPHSHRAPHIPSDRYCCHSGGPHCRPGAPTGTRAATGPHTTSATLTTTVAPTATLSQLQRPPLLTQCLPLLLQGTPQRHCHSHNAPAGATAPQLLPQGPPTASVTWFGKHLAPNAATVTSMPQCTPATITATRTALGLPQGTLLSQPPRPHYHSHRAPLLKCRPLLQRPPLPHETSQS